MSWIADQMTFVRARPVSIACRAVPLDGENVVPSAGRRVASVVGTVLADVVMARGATGAARRRTLWSVTHRECMLIAQGLDAVHNSLAKCPRVGFELLKDLARGMPVEMPA